MTTSALSSKLQVNCYEFSKSAQINLRKFLQVELEADELCVQLPVFNPTHDMYFSILFSGSVYGEFIIGVNQSLALKMLNVEGDATSFENAKEDIFDVFKEVLNISVGQTLKVLDQHFDEITITAPKITLGKLYLPPMPVHCRHLRYKGGEISCYLYVDSMKLNMTASFAMQKTQIKSGEVKIEELRQLNQAKTEFLANMSHELRTPLNGMIGTLDVIKKTELTKTQKLQLEVVEQSGDFLLGIINDILEFSKIESGKIVIEKRKFNLVESIEKTCKVIAHQLYQKNLEFWLEVSGSVPTFIVSDETRIKQILINLIGNAIKFTPKGGIRLSVTTDENQMIRFAVEDNGIGIPSTKLKSIFESFAQADVSDSRKYGGSGLGLTISKALVEALGGTIGVESQEAVGSKFSFTVPIEDSQFESADDRRGSSTVVLTTNSDLFGNLSSMIQNFGGACHHRTDTRPETLANLPEGVECIWIDQEFWMHLPREERQELAQVGARLGKPLIFISKPADVLLLEQDKEILGSVSGDTVVLPIVPSDIQRSFAQQEYFQFEKAAESKPKSATQEGPRHILLVEDNFINQQVAQAMLLNIGVTVEVASNGEEALKKFKPGKYQLVLMDCQMPVLNGFDAAKKIRDIESGLGDKTPIIALTASAFRETKERCFESGMDDFVTKPFKQESLETAIKRNSKK